MAKKNLSHGTIDDFYSQIEGEQLQLCQEIRATVNQVHETHIEIVWPKQCITSYGVGTKKNTQHYIYLAPQKTHLNLGFYHGAGLADPKKLLQGTGKSMRHIKLKSTEDLVPAVLDLISTSIADRVPFMD